MRVHRLLSLSVCILAAAAALPASPDARRKLVERSIQPEVLASDSRGARLAERMRALAAPGLSVAVIEDFKIDWARAYGQANPEGTRLTPELRHNAGSVSKTVCALTAMRLVEMGQLSLDAPINGYLKSWKLPENEFTQQNPVTLRHLLSHSGGTTVHGFPGYGPHDTLPTISQLLDGEPPANSGAVRVNQPPGERYRYSGGGTTIVQLAIQEVTGQPFHTVAHDLVLEPLGMRHSTFVQPVDGVEIGPRAFGHASSPDFSGTIVFTATGAAGLWSTAEDLARMLIGMMKSVRGDEGALLQQQTANEMLTVVNGEAGLGFFIGDHGGARSFSHGGDNTGFHAMVWGLDATGQGAVTLVNSDAGRALQMEFLRAVADVYDWPQDAWEPRRVETGKLDRKTAKAFAGRYRLGADDAVTLTRAGNRLTYRECYWDDRVAELLPLANGNLLLTTGRNHFDHHAEFSFERDERGAVTAMRLVDSSYVLPRLTTGERTTLEHIEAGKMEAALGAWEHVADLSSGLMHYSAQRLSLDSDDQRAGALRLRAFNAEHFPLAEWSQEMQAEAMEKIGNPEQATQIRRRFAARQEQLSAISAQFDAGAVDAALAAFDRLAQEVGSKAAYRWLIDLGGSLENADQALKLARHARKAWPESADAEALLAHALYDNGDRPAAIEAMERSLAIRPAIERPVIARMWARDLWKGETVTLTAEQMSRYVGDYGPRHIVIEDGKLAYYRGSGAPRPLIPVGEHQFMIRGETGFRMQIVVDDDGRPTKIVGHYLAGRKDESPRDSTAPG